MTDSDNRLLIQEMTRKESGAVSDADLVAECLAGGKEALASWEAFFVRFVPVIRDAVARVLTTSRGRRGHVDEDDDAVWEIHEKIVTRLYEGGLLKKCTDPGGIRPWLRTVATNMAKDWLKMRGRVKNLPELSTEAGMRSIDVPLFEDSETTLADMVQSETTVTQEEVEYAEAVLQDFDQMEDRRNYWILRLSIVAVLPMAPDETDDLAGYGQLQAETVRKRVQQITDKVDERVEKRQADLGRAVLLYHQLRRLESKLRAAIEDEPRAGRVPIDSLQQEIDDKAEKRDQLLERTQKLPRPKNIEIAELVGLPEGQEDQITVILKRERQKIRNKWARAKQDEDVD